MSKRDDNLFYEASEGKDARLMKSLDHGANPNEPNNWGQLPLHYAAVRGNFKACAILLGRGSNVNHKDSQGNTTLHYAAKRNHYNIVGLLRDWDADPTLTNTAGQTPLDLASGDRVRKLLERMMTMNGTDPEEKKKKLMEALQADSAMNPFDANGESLMHQYTVTSKIKKVQKLLDKGADPNCANRSNGDTPLHYAVKQGDPKMLTLLIENNAYINAQNNEGKTPLHYACIFQKDVLLHFLIDFQADISILTNAGLSAMQLVKTKKGARLLSVARTRCEPKTHKVIGEYILGQTLGTGSFAKVKVATHIKTKVKSAIKIVQKKSLEAEDVERLSREVHIMRILHHQSIVEFHDHFESERNIYVVMELVSGVDLFDYIYENDPIPEQVVKKIFSQMLEGIGFIHQFGIVHRDLKPENLLVNLDDLEVKIIDFGLSNVQQKLVFETACGSPHYVAPEVLMGRSYGPEVDIWSMGVILHVMLFGELPFDEDTVDITKTPNLESLLEFPPELGRSEEAKDMVKRMLVRNPKKRWTIEQLRAHPWLGLPPQEYVELVDSKDIRPTVLAQMRILGFDEALVVKALKQRYSTPATRIYSLLCSQTRARKKLERVSTVVVGGQNPLQHQRREEQRRLKESFVNERPSSEDEKDEAASPAAAAASPAAAAASPAAAAASPASPPASDQQQPQQPQQPKQRKSKSSSSREKERPKQDGMVSLAADMNQLSLRRPVAESVVRVIPSPKPDDEDFFSEREQQQSNQQPVPPASPSRPKQHSKRHSSDRTSGGNGSSSSSSSSRRERNTHSPSSSSDSLSGGSGSESDGAMSSSPGSSYESKPSSSSGSSRRRPHAPLPAVPRDEGGGAGTASIPPPRGPPPSRPPPTSAPPAPPSGVRRRKER